jgi:hypothetical protein
MTGEQAEKWAKVRQKGRPWFIWSGVAYLGVLVPLLAVALGELVFYLLARQVRDAGEILTTTVVLMAVLSVVCYRRASAQWDEREQEYREFVGKGSA